MRYDSKLDLVESIKREHEALAQLLREIPQSRYREPGVWGDGWTIQDLVAHLAEWHGLFLTWHCSGQEGKPPQMPAPGYKWNELSKLNRAIWARNHDRPWSEVEAEFSSTYSEVLRLVEGLPEEALLTPGHFPWTGEYPLTTYLGPNTASHYRFAIKVLKRWLRSQSPGSGPSTEP